MNRRYKRLERRSVKNILAAELQDLSPVLDDGELALRVQAAEDAAYEAKMAEKERAQRERYEQAWQYRDEYC